MRTLEGFDAQLLCDPLEEDLHLPAAFVEPSDVQRREHEVVGEKEEPFVDLWTEVADAAQGRWILQSCFGPRESNDVIASNAGGFVDFPIGASAVLEVALGPRDEEGQIRRKGVETGKVDIAAVHDIEGARLQHQIIEDIDVVGFAVGDTNEAGNASPKVHQGVQFDGRLAFPESGSWEERKTEIDGYGVEGVGAPDPVRHQRSRWHTAFWPCGPAPGKSRRRYASLASRWHRPTCSWAPCCGYRHGKVNLFPDGQSLSGLEI